MTLRMNVPLTPTLNIIDEISKEALMIWVNRKLNCIDVVDALTDFFILRGPLANFAQIMVRSFSLRKSANGSRLSMQRRLS